MADGALDIVEAAVGVRAFVRNEDGEQFVVFPDGFRIDAHEVLVSREGDSLVLQPVTTTAAPHADGEWADHWAEIDRLRGGDRLSQPEREPDDEIGDGCR